MNDASAIWHQTYSLFGQGLGISALISALPIFTLLFLLGVLRKPAWFAGVVGLAVALVVAILGYGMPTSAAVSAAVFGGAFGLFPISWIIFWAIALFRVTVETGKFEIIRDSIGRLTPDPRVQALLVAFCFGAFLEGGAGFGTPVAVAGAMLTGMGFSAFRASAICLLANTAPVAFGAIGIPVITLAGTTGLPLNKLSGAIALICSPAALIMPIYLIIAMGGFRAMSGVWLSALAAGASFASAQILVSIFMGPQLSAILAALTSMGVLIAVLRLQRRRRVSDKEKSIALAFARDSETDSAVAEPRTPVASQEAVTEIASKQAPGDVAYAWSPYGLLVLCVVLWSFTPVQKILNKGNIVFKWPWLHDVVQRMPPITPVASPYHAVFSFSFFSAAGTACMAATFLSCICLRVSLSRFAAILRGVVYQLTLPIITVSLVIGIGFLMNYCGATATLGLAFASTGRVFPFFSPLLGLLGVFLTGSDTSSNALFGGLQVVTAGRLGLDPILMAAANAAGGVMGKMISVQTIAVAAAATGLSVMEQARLFRFTLRHSIIWGLGIGCLVLVVTYGIHR
ncbi:MAG TPA: lactate permease LctP family transporter [Terracidiphilus sp.]|jgi:lactate permease|nr:lactate permease LctP family transporter [Terracidiphilus sp.]